MAGKGFEVNNQTKRTSEAIVNDPWFVDLSLLEFSDKWSIPAHFKNDLLTDKLIFACDEINQSLLDYLIQKQSEGFNNLAGVTAQEINGESVKVSQYKRAVYAKAKAELVRAQIGLSMKADAQSAAKTSEAQANHYESMSSKALAKIQDKPAIGVYSI